MRNFYLPLVLLFLTIMTSCNNQPDPSRVVQKTAILSDGTCILVNVVASFEPAKGKEYLVFSTAKNKGWNIVGSSCAPDLTYFVDMTKDTIYDDRKNGTFLQIEKAKF